MRAKYPLADDLRSCHTVAVGGYFVEGHVPVEVIARLLKEKPAIDGLALPGMPSGSPGMSGTRTDPLQVFAVVGGKKASVFMTVQ